MTNSVDTGAPCRLKTTNSGSWFGAYRGNTPVQNDENNNRNHITYENRVPPFLSLSQKRVGNNHLFQNCFAENTFNMTNRINIIFFFLLS